MGIKILLTYYAKNLDLVISVVFRGSSRRNFEGGEARKNDLMTNYRHPALIIMWYGFVCDENCRKYTNKIRKSVSDRHTNIQTENKPVGMGDKTNITITHYPPFVVGLILDICRLHSTNRHPIFGVEFLLETLKFVSHHTANNTIT